MKSFVIKEPHDVVVILLRRKWWILLVFLPLATVAALVTVLLPSVYVSETLIMVEPKEVPDDVVKDFVTWGTQDRLTSIERSALSRTNLQRILNEFPDDFRELRHLPDAAQIERLRSRITITVTTTRGREAIVPFFQISYQDRDPGVAQKVTQRLATFFIEQDARIRERQVFQARDFLQSELDNVAQQLDEVDKKLAQLKEEHRYELPEQLDANLRTLDRLQEQLKANAEGRDRYLSLRLELERRLSETLPVITREEQRIQERQAAAETASPLVQQFRQKELQLEELRSRYTERHPDVLRLQAEVERLKEQIPPEDLLDSEPGAATSSSYVNEPNPAYQQISTQLTQVNTELRILETQREGVEREINRYSARIENTPRRELEISSYQRDYDTLSNRYAELDSELSNARESSNLESRQKGEQFQEVDPASLPLAPAKPNRWLVLAVGVGGALGLGIVLAGAVEFLDQKIWTAAEVSTLLGLPLLGEIPRIITETERRQARRMTILQVAAYSIMVLAAAALALYVYRTPQVRSLGTETLARFLGW